MATPVDQHRLGLAGLPVPSATKGRPLTGVASQSYNVVRAPCRFGVLVVTVVRLASGNSKSLVLQASAWEQTAVLSTAQEQSIELVAAECSLRPVPEHVGHAVLAERPNLWQHAF